MMIGVSVKAFQPVDRQIKNCFNYPVGRDYTKESSKTFYLFSSLDKRSIFQKQTFVKIENKQTLHLSEVWKYHAFWRK